MPRNHSLFLCNFSIKPARLCWNGADSGGASPHQACELPGTIAGLRQDGAAGEVGDLFQADAAITAMATEFGLKPEDGYIKTFVRPPAPGDMPHRHFSKTTADGQSIYVGIRRVGNGGKDETLAAFRIETPNRLISGSEQPLSTMLRRLGERLDELRLDTRHREAIAMTGVHVV